MAQSQPYYEPTANECLLFEQAFKNKLPLLLKGPTGCGKTETARQLAKTLGVELAELFWHFLDFLWLYLFLFVTIYQ